MLGERYFATRERLAAVVSGVQELAADTGTDAGLLADKNGFLAKLHEPFVFLVCGEVNAGKSAFINGLFGTELCEVDAVPVTKDLQWFRYGRREHEEERDEFLRYKFRDHEFLLDFSVIDTPGTNGMKEETRAALRELLPKVDLAFFVFPVSNAWGAATWDLVSEFAPELEGRMALVLQQKDQRQEKDMEVMMGHVRELAVQKIGLNPEVFPTSALQALEAKLQKPVRERLLQESGYRGLEDFISATLTRSASRRKTLRMIRDGTSKTLLDIEDRMEVRRRTLDSDEGFLSDIENEVDQEREKQIQLLGEKFSGLGEVFAEQTDQATLWLAERSSILQSLKSLFKKDDTPAQIEKSLVEAIQSEIEKLARKDSDALVAACRGHWQTVIPRIEERLEMPPPDFEKESKGFELARERFGKRLGGAARKAVVAQKIRGMLEHEMEAQRDSLRRFVTFALLAFTGAGLLGFFQLNLWAVALFAVGVVFFVMGVMRLRRSSLELVEWFQEKSSACRRPFAEQLSQEYEEGVRGFFVEYVAIFEDIRRHVADLSMKLKPQLERWNNLFLEVNAIDQDI